MTPPKADPLAERIAARVAKLQHGPSYVGYESSHLRRATHYAAEARAYFAERLGRERVATTLLHFDQERSHLRLSALDEVHGKDAYLAIADAIRALLEPDGEVK
jgi:hypothetical protein